MKSLVTELLAVFSTLLKDVETRYAVKVDSRDVAYATNRACSEGVSFFTLTLPSFAADFENCLRIGKLDSSLFRPFKKVKSKGGIPAFLQGITSLVLQNGTITTNPDAVHAIRQLCLFAKKIEFPCSVQAEDKAYQSFVEIEEELACFAVPGSKHELESVCRFLYQDIPDITDFDHVLPKHGPGATNERIYGNQKYRQRSWPSRLEKSFPFIGNATPLSDISGKYQEVRFDRELPVRVISVPKTAKGPRLIAIEPVAMQYCQQALKDYLVDHLERSPITGGSVNFTNQSINRWLAQCGSATGRWATIDLSSASDRVPAWGALMVLAGKPTLQRAVFDTRSRYANVRGKVIRLRKFASMGSALCFPIEAMYFYALCVYAIVRSRGCGVNNQSIRHASRLVYVYGDDIIVPTDYAAAVAETLQEYNCKLNATKSYWTSSFRESCGGDYYDGIKVTPIYLRRWSFSGQQRTSTLVSLVATANLFFKAGFWATSDLLFARVEQHLGRLPTVGSSCEGLGKHSFMGVPDKAPTGRFQRPEVVTWVAKPVYSSDPIDGYAALTKCLLHMERSNEPVPNKRHLKESVRFGAVTLKRRRVALG